MAKARRLKRKKKAKAKAKKATLVFKEEFSFPPATPVPQRKPIAPPIGQEAEAPLIQFSKELQHIEEKKRLPHAASAIAGSLGITVVFLAIFLLALKISPFYALFLSIAIFFGFSILFYNLLESRRQ